MNSITRLEIEQNCFLFALSGSHAYGLNTETSDRDYKGITVAPKRFYTGFKKFEQKDKGWNDEAGIFLEHDEPVDSTVYEIRRFLELTANQNPNILEMMWQREDNYLVLNDIGKYLLQYKTHFLTKKMSKSFTGYAHAQIKKMMTHRKWLLLENPPDRPDPADYGIEHDEFPLRQDDIQRFLEFLYTLVRDRIGYFEESRELYSILQEIDYKQVLKQYPLPTDSQTTEMVQELTRANKDFISLLHASQRYHNDLKYYESYWNWKRTRNEKRSAIEAKCGYDGKNATIVLVSM